MRHKTGRNNPCWCGSGRKFKRCHWPSEENIVKEREVFGSFGLNPLVQNIKQPKTERDIDTLLSKINAQKLSNSRPKPSTKLISTGEIPCERTRRFLVDLCAELVDENWTGRSDMCLYFAVLLRDALCLLGFQADVHLGKATYFSLSDNSKTYTWDHAWVVYDNYIVDGNIDSIVENPFCTDGIEPSPYWGLIDVSPDDRKFITERILKPQNDIVELDEKEINEWKRKLVKALKENRYID
jgi:hypothetical protein